MAVYSADSFTALEIPTLAKMNKLWTNDASMNDGNGIGTGVINNRHFAAGVVVQEAIGVDTTVKTGTTLIPYDSSIPQNNEGTEFMTFTFTPKAATNRLIIDVLANLYHGNTTQQNTAIALFQDSVANAIAAQTYVAALNAGSLGAPTPLRHTMIAGTTSPITFKVRVGPQVSGTVTFNGIGGGGFFGGVMQSSIKVTEIKV